MTKTSPSVNDEAFESKRTGEKQIPTLFYMEGTCSLGALITAAWIEKPFQVCRLEGGDIESEDYLVLNGLGEVPLVYEDGVILTENTAILHHLAARNPEKGVDFPANTPKYDQLNRALGFLTSDFHKSFFAVFSPEALHSDKKVQKEIRERVIQGRLREIMLHAENHLFDADSPFLFSRPMIVDAYLFAMIRWTKSFYDLGKEFPNLKRFQDAMKEDPGVKLALEIESGKLTEAKDFFKGAIEFKSFIKEAVARKKARDSSGETRPGLSRSDRETRENLQPKQA